MQGILYGIGVGPGDPELMTLKAVRLIREADIIALPQQGDKKDVTAWEIAKQAVDMTDKPLLFLPMPMTKDEALLNASHDQAAALLIEQIKLGKSICFLTLGDPSVYSTYIYVHERVLQAGYPAQLVAGITSFCAVAARLNKGLVEREQMLHVIPGTYNNDEFAYLDLPGTKAIMKSGKTIAKLKEELYRRDLRDCSSMVACCGMPNERVYTNLDELDANSSYFSLVIVKERKLEK